MGTGLKGVLVVVVALLLLSKWAGGATLKAAAAKIDITPPVGHQLWGNGERLGPSTGVLDRLYARILVLKSEEASLGIVALDLGRSFDEEQIADVKAEIQAAGIEHIIFAASHTHSGPTLLSKKHISAGGARWEPKALAAIGEGIRECSRRLVSCRVGAAKGTAYIGHNRSDLLLRGHVMTINEAQVRTVPLDPVLQVVRLDDSRGKPIAFLVNYACHPITLNAADSTEYSADFPGVMSTHVEDFFPGRPVCLFIQGAAGDIASRYSSYRSTEKGSGGHGVLVREMRQLGLELGREVIRVTQFLHTEEPSHQGLSVIEDRMIFRARWNLEKLKELQAVPTYHQWLTTGRPLGYPPEQSLALITTVLINRKIAILTMPGEPYVDYQIDFRSRLPGIDTLLAGYSNGYLAYIPTIRAEAQYEDSTWPAILEVGAGERIVDRGIINVHRMLGSLKDLPGRLP
jgi:neutral ceramidase